MAIFYYNPDSSQTAHDQWSQYLKTSNAAQDLSFAVDNKQAVLLEQQRAYEKMLRVSDERETGIIHDATRSLCGTFTEGINVLSSQLGDINDNLGHIKIGVKNIGAELGMLSAKLDLNFSLLINEQRRGNQEIMQSLLYTGTLSDEQKRKQEAIKRGVRFFRNAVFNEEMFEDALQNFITAENIEATDYDVLHKIGQIYLFSPHHLDLEQAESYFEKAAKYSVVETKTGATRTQNHLDQYAEVLGTPQPKPIINQASSSFGFAGAACYLQGKFFEAVTHIRKAHELTPHDLETAYLYAKFLAADGQGPQAAEELEKLITKNHLIILKALSDPDLGANQDILNLFLRLQQDAIAKAKRFQATCYENILPDSQAWPILHTIDGYIDQNTYLAAKQAIEEFEVEREWTLDRYVKPSRQVSASLFIRRKTFYASVIDFIETEARCKAEVAEIERLRREQFQAQKELPEPQKPERIQLNDREYKRHRDQLIKIGAIVGVLLGFVIGALVEDARGDFLIGFGLTVVICPLLGAIIAQKTR